MRIVKKVMNRVGTRMRVWPALDPVAATIDGRPAFIVADVER
ncbi:hypothetical protein [Kitasatospora sp. NPDC005748]